MPSATTVLEDACDTGIRCLDDRSLVVVAAQSVSGGLDANAILSEACNTGLRCLSRRDLLTVIAQTLSNGSTASCTIETDSPLPDGTDGTPYSEAITADVPATFAVIVGALPDGLTLNPDGTITGTPTLPVTDQVFTVEATPTGDESSCTKEFTMTVIPAEPPAFTPSSISGLLLWLKADSFSLPDNTIIGGPGLEWEDQSGNNNDGTAAFGNVTYQTDGIGGSLPSIEFGGTTLAIPAITAIGSSDFTIVIVAETTGDTSWLGNNAANVQIRRRRSGVNNASFFPGSGSEVISQAFDSADAAVVMIVWRRSGGSGISFRENKTDKSPLAPPDSNAGGFTLNRIGMSQFVGGSGDVGEICMYDNAVSNAQLDQLYDDYMKARWGLP